MWICSDSMYSVCKSQLNILPTQFAQTHNCRYAKRETQPRHVWRHDLQRSRRHSVRQERSSPTRTMTQPPCSCAERCGSRRASTSGRVCRWRVSLALPVGNETFVADWLKLRTMRDARDRFANPEEYMSIARNGRWNRHKKWKEVDERVWRSRGRRGALAQLERSVSLQSKASKSIAIHASSFA